MGEMISLMTFCFGDAPRLVTQVAQPGQQFAIDEGEVIAALAFLQGTPLPAERLAVVGLTGVGFI